MIRVKIISVGKTPADWRRDAVNHYIKLASPFACVEQTTVKEQKVRHGGDIGAALQRETESLLEAVSDSAFSFGLDLSGKRYSTEAFAKRFEQILESSSSLNFVVGGAFGLDPSRLGEFHELLSLSSMTLPHDLASVVLMEQIYRALTIIRGHPYHK